MGLWEYYVHGNIGKEGTIHSPKQEKSRASKSFINLECSHLTSNFSYNHHPYLILCWVLEIISSSDWKIIKIRLLMGQVAGKGNSCLVGQETVAEK
jgi:hypothetical protein